MELEIVGLVFVLGLSLGVLAGAALGRRREDSTVQAWTAERELMRGAMLAQADAAGVERKELYSRIQAYDPNAGDFTPPPPSITAAPSQPGEETLAPRSFTQEELGQLGLVEQADGVLRDTRNNALFETVEDWRDWQATLRKRNLPENVHPSNVQELGWEQAFAQAKAETAAKKAANAAKN